MKPILLLSPSLLESNLRLQPAVVEARHDVQLCPVLFAQRRIARPVDDPRRHARLPRRANLCTANVSTISKTKDHDAPRTLSLRNSTSPSPTPSARAMAS